MLQPSVRLRSTASYVAFAHPFRLGGDSRELPAGTYRVYTHEDVYEGAFDPVRVASSIELIVEVRGAKASRINRPSDLAAALVRDTALSDLLGELSENPDRGRSDGEARYAEGAA